MSVPLPPKRAERFNTVCQFCIVGCGYRVFKWPVGRDGGPAPGDNALGVDFRAPLDAMGLSPIGNGSTKAELYGLEKFLLYLSNQAATSSKEVGPAIV